MYTGYWRYRYRNWRFRDQKPSKYALLLNLFGEAVSSIKKTFLSLDSEALDELFKDYGSFYGVSAEKYARKTFPKWRSGETNLSGQTMERLVSLVPPYLSAEKRFDLLKEVLKKHKQSAGSKLTEEIKIHYKEPALGLKQVERVLANMNKDDTIAYIPENVMNAAKWLYDDDITASRAMIAEAEVMQNEMIKSKAEREIKLLMRAISSGQVKEATYYVEMPAGTLSIIVYSPMRSFWNMIRGI